MKKLLVICLTFFSVTSLIGCKSTKKQVCVTSYPVEYITSRIAGDNIDVKLLSEGDTIQVATIKNNYMDIINNSDAVFYINNLEPYYDIYNDKIRSTNVKMIDLASKSDYYKFKKTTTSIVDGNSVVEYSPYYEGTVFDNVDLYINDPMIWMDPTGFIGSATTIKNYLIDLYPDYEDEFEKNYKKLEIDLAKLDSEYQGLKGYSISFVSMTPSFGNLEKPYGVNVFPIVLSKYGALPNESQLEIIKSTIINNNVNYIVHESNLNDEMEKLYSELVAELGLYEIELSNISLLSKDEKDKNLDYLTIMYENLKTLESIGE